MDWGFEIGLVDLNGAERIQTFVPTGLTVFKDEVDGEAIYAAGLLRPGFGERKQHGLVAKLGFQIWHTDTDTTVLALAPPGPIGLAPGRKLHTDDSGINSKYLAIGYDYMWNQGYVRIEFEVFNDVGEVDVEIWSIGGGVRF